MRPSTRKVEGPDRDKRPAPTVANVDPKTKPQPRVPQVEWPELFLPKRETR